jgi:hypothetical protein
MFIVDGKEIVILEAALLLDASWNNLVHEVWTSIVPSGEVITMKIRIMIVFATFSNISDTWR